MAEQLEKENKLVKSTAVSAMMIMLSMVISRILGFVRDMIISNQFGQSYYTDAYNAAFSIPDFIYMILVGGAFSAAFVPTFSSYIAKGKEDEAWKIASITLNAVCVGMLLLLGAAFIFTPQLLGLIVKNFDAVTMDLAVKLTRIMLMQVVFMALAGICSGILQSYKIFGPTAYGGVIYNLGTIIIGGCFSGLVEKYFPGYGIAAFSIGVVMGAFGNFLIQAVSLKSVGIRYTPSLDVRNPDFSKMLGLMVPVLIGLSANELSLFVNQYLASGLSEGLLSAWKMASRFMQLPISIFAISIAMTLFPVLTREAATDRIDDFRKDYSHGLQTIFFICIPCSVLLAVLGEPFIRLLFETGKFTAENTSNTAYALVLFSFGIFAQGGIHLSSRAFYAFQDTKTPVLMAVLGIVVNVILSILLIGPLKHGGLALAYSIGGIVNLFLLMWALRRRLGHINIGSILKSSLQTLFASAIMGVAAWLIAWGCEAIFGIANKGTQAVQLFAAGILSVVVFLVVAKMMKMPEADTVFGMMKRRFRRG